MNKTKSVIVRVDQETIDALDEIASIRGITRSAVVRNLLVYCQSCYSFLEREWKHTEGLIHEGIVLEGRKHEEGTGTPLDDIDIHELALWVGGVIERVARRLEERERGTQ